jgi:hypothetical protein
MMAVETPHVHTLVDETDTAIRSRQHASIFAAIALLAVSRAFVGNPSSFWFGILAIVVALALFVLGATSVQRWDLQYKGHTIRYQNNPLRGERLFVDGKPAAKGKFGYRSEMRAPLGNGETVVAQSEAGLARFRCHIFVESADAPASVRMSDDELLAEVQRRGLRT